MQKEVDVSKVHNKFYPRDNPYILVIPILSAMKITLRAETSARHFPKTWSQSGSFIQHHPTLKIRLVLKIFVMDPFNMHILNVFIYLQQHSKISLWIPRMKLLQRFISVLFLVVVHISPECPKPSILGQQKHIRLLWNHWGASRNGGEKNPTKLHCSWRTHLEFPHFAASFPRVLNVK